MGDKSSSYGVISGCHRGFVFVVSATQVRKVADRTADTLVGYAEGEEGAQEHRVQVAVPRQMADLAAEEAAWLSRPDSVRASWGWYRRPEGGLAGGY